MKIDTEALKLEINALTKIIEEYEDNYLNLHNCISSLSFFWQGINADKFINQRIEELKEIKITISEFETIKDTYKFIYNQYTTIGNKIELDLSFEKKVETIIYQCKKNIEATLYLYDDINLRIDSKLNEFFEKEIRLTRNNLRIINELEEKMKRTLNELIEIERRVTNKIQKIKIKPIID